MKSVILIARKNRSRRDEPQLPGQLQSSHKREKEKARQGKMNSTRRDTPTHTSTKRSIIMPRSGQGGAGPQKVVIRNIWHVSVRRGGEVGQVERLELRLDKHSHYAQLTICCHAIKYLSVDENPLRKCHSKVQGSMESTAITRILCPRPEVCSTKFAEKARPFAHKVGGNLNTLCFQISLNIMWNIWLQLKLSIIHVNI